MGIGRKRKSTTRVRDEAVAEYRWEERERQIKYHWERSVPSEQEQALLRFEGRELSRSGSSPASDASVMGG